MLGRATAGEDAKKLVEEAMVSDAGSVRWSNNMSVAPFCNCEKEPLRAWNPMILVIRVC